MARRGRAWAPTGHGTEGQASLGRAGRGEARLGWARRGQARPGGARQGEGPDGANQPPSKGAKMIDPKPEISAKVDELYTVVAEMGRGDVLTEDAIAAVIGPIQRTKRWNHIIRRALARLEQERGIAYWYRHDVGYELLTRSDQLNKLPGWRMKKSMRQIARIKRSTKAMPEQGLSDHQRRIRTVTIERMAEIESSLKAQQNEHQALFRPAMVHPRRIVH